MYTAVSLYCFLYYIMFKNEFHADEKNEKNEFELAKCTLQNIDLKINSQKE